MKIEQIDLTKNDILSAMLELLGGSDMKIN